MRIAVIGDFHGRSLEGLPDLSDFDGIYCLGDFDTLECLEEFKDIEESFERKGKEVKKVAGNHDDAIYQGLNIRSSTLEEEGLDAKELHRKWAGSEGEIAEYIKNFADLEAKNYQGVVELELRNRKGVLVHGGLTGDVSSYRNCPKDRAHLWRRLIKEEDYVENFEEMCEKGYKWMLRGHDHEPKFSYRDEERDVVTYSPNEGDYFRLRNDKPVIITNGAWYDGWYSVIHEEAGYETPLITFKRRKNIKHVYCGSKAPLKNSIFFYLFLSPFQSPSHFLAPPSDQL